MAGYMAKKTRLALLEAFWLLDSREEAGVVGAKRVCKRLYLCWLLRKLGGTCRMIKLY
jgi:hypothetical protein